MKSQHEKNKETLTEEIEKLCEKPITDATASKLSAYHGALKAMCWAENDWKEDAASAEARAADKPSFTPELDGDTEFERVIMTIPADAAHMIKITHVFNKHLEDLKFANARAYNSIMDQLREVAKS